VEEPAEHGRVVVGGADRDGGVAQVHDVLAGRRTGARISKRDLVLELCRGKSVLDLGCVEHSWRMSLENPRWLHAEIAAVASSCVGVDFLERDVAELNARGFSMLAGNVLTDEPPDRFEVVVAGDLIEHVENAGVFLEYVAKALTEDGIAIVTTPNALYPAQLWSVLGRGRPEISPEHVALYDPFTFANLVERSPLRLVELRWLELTWSAFSRSRNPLVRLGVWAPLHALTRLAAAARPYLASDFAAILERRPEGERPQPAESAKLVMDFLGRG
jgi:SAM-dependent methyltransferase